MLYDAALLFIHLVFIVIVLRIYVYRIWNRYKYRQYLNYTSFWAAAPVEWIEIRSIHLHVSPYVHQHVPPLASPQTPLTSPQTLMAAWLAR